MFLRIFNKFLNMKKNRIKSKYYDKKNKLRRKVFKIKKKV